jgi:hypothetical protein
MRREKETQNEDIDRNGATWSAQKRNNLDGLTFNRVPNRINLSVICREGKRCRQMQKRYRNVCDDAFLPNTGQMFPMISSLRFFFVFSLFETNVLTISCVCTHQLRKTSPEFQFRRAVVLIGLGVYQTGFRDSLFARSQLKKKLPQMKWKTPTTLFRILFFFIPGFLFSFIVSV